MKKCIFFISLFFIPSLCHQMAPAYDPASVQLPERPNKAQCAKALANAMSCYCRTDLPLSQSCPDINAMLKKCKDCGDEEQLMCMARAEAIKMDNLETADACTARAVEARNKWYKRYPALNSLASAVGGALCGALGVIVIGLRNWPQDPPC